MNKNFNWNLDNLSKNQKKIANFIESEIKSIPFLTEQEIADHLHISIASVSRFWKAIGYKNLKEFKLQLMTNLDITPAIKMQSLISKVQGDDLPTNMLNLGKNYLDETSSKLSRNNFDLAIKAIQRARHIYIFAQGAARGLAQLLQYRLKRYGFVIHIIEINKREIFESLIHLNKDDLVIIFNFSSIYPETKVILDYAIEAKYQTILISDIIVSEVIDQADLVLYSYRGQLYEFHSMVAPTMLVESIIVGVGIEEKEAAFEKLEHLNKLRKRYAASLQK